MFVKLKAFLFTGALIAGASLILPLAASAHEVYVLGHNEVAQALNGPALDILGVITEYGPSFALWTVICLAIVAGALTLSISRWANKQLAPIFNKIKKLAPPVVQISLGSALVASGLAGTLFGPELALLITLFSPLQWLLIVSGALILLGLFSRLAALVFLAMFVFLLVLMGPYAVNYLTFAGAAVFILLNGPAYGFDRRVKTRSLWISLAPALLRLSLGMSIVFASVYAKYLKSGLALATVEKYGLAQIFHTDPAFLVLGAFLIELSVGIFFILGFALRFTALVTLVLFSVSLAFFGEAVWPHIILLGTALAIFLHGYDQYTLMGYLFKKRPPVL